MWPYWAMFMLVASGVLMPARLPPRQSAVVMATAGIVLALLMGLRHEVGGDWFSYINHFGWVESLPLVDALSQFGDPAYYTLSWLIAHADGSIHALNLACAAVLVAGTIFLARRQPLPWLALLAAVPYLLIVVGMGYTRQSAAIGLAMLGLVALGERRVRWFVFWVLFAAAFHKSAVLLLPVAALAASRQRVWTAVWVAAVAAVGAWMFIGDRSETLWLNYVQSDYAFASEGASVRLAMNAVPAVLLLLLRRRLIPDRDERRLWIWLALLALASIPLLQVSTTAIDRLALYFIPLQLVVLSRLPFAASSVRGRTFIAVGIVCYLALVQFVWLNFAGHAFAWLPYRNVLFL